MGGEYWQPPSGVTVWMYAYG